MRPTSPGSGLTSSYSLACSLRWLRSHALYKLLPHSPSPTNEVLPHNYGTDKKEPSNRTTQSLHSEAYVDSSTDTSATQPGCLRQSGLDDQQLRRAAGVNFLRRATAAGVGLFCAASARRAGNCAGQSVGEEEEVGRLRAVIGSSRGETCDELSIFSTSYWTGGREFNGWHPESPC